MWRTSSTLVSGGKFRNALWRLQRPGKLSGELQRPPSYHSSVMRTRMMGTPAVPSATVAPLCRDGAWTARAPTWGRRGFSAGAATQEDPDVIGGVTVTLERPPSATILEPTPSSSNRTPLNVRREAHDAEHDPLSGPVPYALSEGSRREQFLTWFRRFRKSQLSRSMQEFSETEVDEDEEEEGSDMETPAHSSRSSDSNVDTAASLGVGGGSGMHFLTDNIPGSQYETIPSRELWGRHKLTGKEVFANADCSLNYVEVFGFDYDFTICHYKNQLGSLIYDMACEHLVKLGYPSELRQKKFDPDFAIRGLHVDRKTGYLLKVDQFNRVLTDCVFFGRERVPGKTVVEKYEGVRLSPAYMKLHLTLMTDLFCQPEATLIADLIQICRNKGLKFSPTNLVDDVRDAVRDLHLSGRLHSVIANDPSRYLHDNPKLLDYLRILRKGGKKTFLLTNSPFPFVDAGMRYLARNILSPDEIHDWTRLFDVVICSSKKPKWYTNQAPFRVLERSETGYALSLHAAEEFRPGSVYTGGGMYHFNQLFKKSFGVDIGGHGSTINGSNVMYFGDHIFSDLSKPNKFAAWKTAAIMPEILHETRTIQLPAFQNAVRRLSDVQRLVDYGQCLSDEESKAAIAWLKTERSHLREFLKNLRNPNFGSVFRTHTHRTFFFFEVLKYADVYAASVDSFANYPLDWCFYASRTPFVHEGSVHLGF